MRRLKAGFCLAVIWTLGRPAIAASGPGPSAAPAAPTASAALLRPTPARIGLTWERLALPGDERMGFLGGSLLYDVRDWLAIGPATHGALTGRRGGFITIDLASEVRRRLGARVELNGGLLIGAGGGRGGYALSGGGLMLRGHLGLRWRSPRLGDFDAGVSRVSFPDGAIRSTQPFVAWRLPLRVLLARDGAEAGTPPLAAAARPPAVAQEFAVVCRAYSVPHGVADDAGLPQHRGLRLAGVEWRRQFGDRLFVSLGSAGALGGRNSGYMQILLGGGCRLPLADRTAATLSVAAGAAGGGGVATGGGLLLDGALALQRELSGGFFVEGAAGGVTAPGARFRAASVALKFGCRFGSPALGDGLVGPAALSGFAPRRFRWRVAHAGYLRGDPAWRTHHADRNVGLLACHADWFVRDSLYLTGQAAAACSGMAGAYAAGLLGAGAHLQIGASSRLFLEAEGLVGAAGGGGMDVGGGLVRQAGATLGWRLSESHSVQGGCGLIDAVDGRFRATVVSVAFGWRFATFSRQLP